MLARRFEGEAAGLRRFKGNADALLVRRCARTQLRTVLSAWHVVALRRGGNHRLVARFQQRRRKATLSRCLHAWRGVRHLAAALQQRDAHHQALRDPQVARLVFLSWWRLAVAARTRACHLQHFTHRRTARALAVTFGAWRDHARTHCSCQRLLAGTLSRWARASAMD